MIPGVCCLDCARSPWLLSREPSKLTEGVDFTVECYRCGRRECAGASNHRAECSEPGRPYNNAQNESRLLVEHVSICDNQGMGMAEIRERIDKVVALDDPEEAHAQEDSIMRDWIQCVAGPDVLREFERLWDADFPRWYA